MFNHAFYGTGQFISGFGVYSGNFRVEGNEIILTNQIYSWTDFKNPSRNVTDRQESDSIYSFEFVQTDDGEEGLRINDAFSSYTARRNQD